ncbi:hypothetical protein WA158_001584 [Blastocystis sp. Blastoise]
MFDHDLPEITNLFCPNARIAIVRAKWHADITERAEKAVISVLEKANVTEIKCFSAPGSYELPLACKYILDSGFDAVIAIGLLIKGSTMHFEYISEAVSQGLMRLGLDTGKPVIFGVLTCLNEDQARLRCGFKDNDESNHGYGWAQACLEMLTLKEEASKKN